MKKTRERILTKLDKAHMVMMRGLGYSQARIAKLLGVAQEDISYQLKMLRLRSDEEGLDSVFQEQVFILLKHWVRHRKE